MDKGGLFGEMLEKGQHTAANAVKSAVSDVAGSVAGQIGVKNEASPDTQRSSQNQGQTNAQNQNQKPTEASKVQAASTEETKQFVKEFYAPSAELPEGFSGEAIQQAQQKDQLETQQKLANLRQELHKEGYYEPLIAYETKKPEEQGEGEGAAKRVEKQEQEEEQKKMELEQKEAQEKQDIAKTRAQRKVEANPGIAG